MIVCLVISLLKIRCVHCKKLYMSIHLHTYICVCLYICICLYVFICLYLHTYIHIYYICVQFRPTLIIVPFFVFTPVQVYELSHTLQEAGEIDFMPQIQRELNRS
jgi:hypothetical protein